MIKHNLIDIGEMILKKKMNDSEVRITFVLPENHTNGAVAVVGSFNDWDPGAHVFNKKAGENSYSTSLILPVGNKYIFRYLGEGGHWFDEDAADGYESNDYGSGNSLLLT